LAVVLFDYELVNFVFELNNRSLILKFQFFRNILLFVVGLKRQLIEIQSLRRREWHIDLVSEKSVRNVVGGIVVQNYHDNAAYHFADLMVDEALPYDVEN